MNINLSILLWALPSFITLGVLRARKRPTKEIFALLGWRLSSLRYYLFGVILALMIGGLLALTFWLFARDLLFHPVAGTTQAAYAHLTLSPLIVLFIFVSEAVFSTLGEELFFRGLLGGWLRFRAGSIWPGWLSHTLVNTVSDLFPLFF